MSSEYFYLGTYSVKGNNRVAAYRSQELAWITACYKWPAKPLRDKKEAMAWLRMSVSEQRAKFYLRQAERKADKLDKN